MASETTQHMQFVERMRDIGKKTLVWSVDSLDGTIRLGEVRWCSQWRKYAFYAKCLDTIFDEACLREIADFVERKTAEHKAKNITLV